MSRRDYLGMNPNRMYMPFPRNYNYIPMMEMQRQFQYNQHMTYNPNPLYHQAHQLIYQTNEDKNDAISDVVDNSLSFDPRDNRAYNSENTIQHRIKTEQVDDSDQTYDFDEDHDETQYQDISETKPISAIFELADNDILKSKINGLLYSNGIKYATNEAVT